MQKRRSDAGTHADDFQRDSFSDQQDGPALSIRGSRKTGSVHCYSRAEPTLYNRRRIVYYERRRLLYVCS